MNPSAEGAGKFCEAPPVADKASRIWRSGRKNGALATVFSGTASGQMNIPLSAPAKSTCENKCFFVWRRDLKPTAQVCIKPIFKAYTIVFIQHLRRKGGIHKEVTPEKKTSSLEFILYSVRQIGICTLNISICF